MSRKRKHNPYLFEHEEKDFFNRGQQKIGFDYERTSGYTQTPVGGYGNQGYVSYGGYGHGNYDYYTNYNWSQFNNYGYTTDIPEHRLLVKKPNGYATPDKKDIEQKLRKVGHISTDTNEILIADFARYYYYQLLDDTNYLKASPATSVQEAICKVLTEKWNSFTNGGTPLDKAITLFVELATNPPSDEEVVRIPIDVLGENVKIHTRVFKDAIYNDLLDRLEMDPSKKLSILQKLSLIQDFGTEFKVEKETVDKLANNSRLTAQKMMRDYSQLHMVEAYQRLLPNYKAKLLTKNLVVKAHIDRVENKQKIIMIVDYSGSMGSTIKQEWVMALMIDRLKYVIKGEAELFFSYFVCSPSGLRFSHIHDSASAMAFWKTFRTNPNGGETDMGTIVDYIGKQIKSGKFHNLDVDLSREKPEILIVNDGNDQVHADAFSYKTNALTLLRNNDELRDLCKANGGRYVHVSNDSKVHYS
jgi:hypothetical protein